MPFVPAFFALALALGAPALAQGPIYKCAGERNQPVYQDVPCPPGTELRNLERDPATVSVIPGRLVPGTTTRLSAPPPAKPKSSGTAPKKEKAPAGDATERKHIRLGMNEGEVVARIGRPDMTSGGKGRRLARWTYMPATADPQTITTIVLEYGQVIDVERKVMK